MKEMPRHQRMIEGELERALIHLKAEMLPSEDYTKTLTLVERLHGLTDKTRPSTVDKNTLVVVGANLTGIILIIMHEHVGNFISSKALGFVLRPR